MPPARQAHCLPACQRLADWHRRTCSSAMRPRGRGPAAFADPDSSLATLHSQAALHSCPAPGTAARPVLTLPPLFPPHPAIPLALAPLPTRLPLLAGIYNLSKYGAGALRALSPHYMYYFWAVRSSYTAVVLPMHLRFTCCCVPLRWLLTLPLCCAALRGCQLAAHAIRHSPHFPPRPPLPPLACRRAAPGRRGRAWARCCWL